MGEIGGGVAVNIDMPNVGPRVSIYGGKGELLARLGNTNWGRRGPIPSGLRSLQKLTSLL